MDNLRKGDFGSLVSMAQLALRRAGFYSENPDGIFGMKTDSAVRYFQYRNSLSTDGIIGNATWNALEKYIRGYFVYTLKRGDTFFKLANRYSTSVDSIITANPNADSSNLMIGQKIYIPFGFRVVPTNIPYSYDLTRLIADGLAVRYPFIKKTNIGKSEMGKDIFSLKIGNGSNEVSYNAAHHANEWITIPVLMKFLEDYSSAYTKHRQIGNENARNLFQRTSLYLVPIVNPDGVDLVTNALSSGGYYNDAVNISENYPNIRFPQGWKANIKGTDLNLNYPADWERAKELKYAAGFVSPAPRDFVGTAPLSATESKAVYDFTLAHNFRLILAYHTQGEIIFWKYLDFDPPRALEIGEEMSRVSGYSLEITPEFSSYAGYKDWFIQTYNLPGYTIEAGRGVNPLPLSQFSKIYNDNLGILTTGLSEA